MTRKSNAAKTSRVAQFISRRIYELQSRKSKAEIAAEAGFNSAGMISMIASGKAKMPIERAVQLAKALECDPAVLVRLGLEQSFTPALIDQIFRPTAGTTSGNEQVALDPIPGPSFGGDPELAQALFVDRSERIAHSFRMGIAISRGEDSVNVGIIRARSSVAGL